MSLPTIAVAVAFATNPTATPSWTDVSRYWRTLSVRRGRQDELAVIEAGIADIVFNNNDRRFDPTATSGPYYGTLRVTRRLRFQATWAGVTYDLFHGYVEGWPQEWSANGNEAHVTVTATDGFSVLASARVNGDFVQQRTDERVSAILDAANWRTGSSWQLDVSTFDSGTVLGPVGDRQIDQGQSTIQAVTLTDTVALDHLQDVAKSENGLLFMGKDGAVVFQSRNRRYAAGYATSLATFGDSDALGELPYSDPVLRYDTTYLWNEVRVTATGSTAQVAHDTTSQDEHFPRTLTRETFVTTDAEALSAAEYLLSLYKDEQVRIEGLTLKPQRDDRLWPLVLGLELGDKVTVRRRPPGGGNMIEQVSFVEGITHDVVPGFWTTTLTLSPADQTQFWLLDVSVFDATPAQTRLAY